MMNNMKPKEYLPKVHVNYENRLMDWHDDLPKFESKPMGPKCHNDGTRIEAN